jgi:hypothetical protein
MDKRLATCKKSIESLGIFVSVINVNTLVFDIGIYTYTINPYFLPFNKIKIMQNGTFYKYAHIDDVKEITERLIKYATE